jgi:tetratricopeptide (TPR) repeat protein
MLLESFKLQIKKHEYRLHFPVRRTVLAADLSILVAIVLAMGIAYWQERVATSRIEVFGGFAQELSSKNYSAAEQILLKALPSPEFADPFSQSDLHHRLADLQLTHLGNESAAANNYSAALSDLANETSPRAMQQSADISRELGILEDNRGRAAEALKHFEFALARVQTLGSSDAETSLFENLGIAHNHLKDFERAEFYLEKARERIEAAQPVNLNRLAFVQNNLASTIRKRGQPDRALSFAMKAVQVADSSDDTNLKAATYDTVAMIHADLGQYGLALEFIERALALDLKEEFISAFLRETHGLVLNRLDRKAEACASWRESVDLYERTENKDKQDAVRRQMAGGGC